MTTYETLTKRAQDAEEWIDYYERIRDKADFMAEHLPECITELEDVWVFTRSWLRYRQSWYDLPPDTRQTIEGMARTLFEFEDRGTVELELDIDGELIIIDFGISKEEWHGQ